jgi:cephalosporin-C deacetylase-like acetyl esterase
MKPALCATAVALLALAACRADAQQDTADLVKQIQALKPSRFEPGSEQAKEQQAALASFVRLRRDEVNRASTDAWNNIKNKQDWEQFRAAKIKALRDSLGVWPEAPKKLNVRVTRTIKGDGYVLENLIYESRPGLWVTANLYSPLEPPASMPGILICHSHHNPKSQGELQDMGMNWARQGCVVLVPDQVGHGERRQHPFTDASKSDQKFAASRQDYYFRYNVGNQLHLIGDSQTLWMVWDMMRGVDLLLGRKGVDKNRIILLGSVAGGGDPTAVTAALDERISAVVPFNFGGPQPETTFPLPAGAEAKFNYMGGGSWESTRGLRLAGRDGFLPWVIVGAAAPRGLIYAHEFAWDQDRDPVWKRFETIYGWYGKPDWVSAVKGKGSVKGKAGPDNTHCNNIGAVHRAPMYPTLKRWFDMTPPLPEFKDRRDSAELQCLTPAVRKDINFRSVAELADGLAGERLSAARTGRAQLPPPQQREQIGKALANPLGGVGTAGAKLQMAGSTKHADFVEDRFTIEGEPAWAEKAKGGFAMPVNVLLLRPVAQKGARPPVVVAVAQHGKAAFLKDRAEIIAALLKQNVAVCLVDVRGTGETSPGEGRGRQSTGTSLSANEQMLGGTLLGARVRDLRMALTGLRSHYADLLDLKRVAVWGDSFAPVNAAGARLDVPYDAAKLPDQAEPLGGLVALLTALYEPDIKAVYVRGGLTSYRSLLKTQFPYLPHDALVPGVLTVADLDDVAAALAPRALRLEALVTGQNQLAAEADVMNAYGLTRAAYQTAKQGQRFVPSVEPSTPAVVARWLAEQLRAP